MATGKRNPIAESCLSQLVIRNFRNRQMRSRTLEAAMDFPLLSIEATLLVSGSLEEFFRRRIPN
jgi:hypothetical protein